MNFDAEDMAGFLMEVIDKLKELKRPVGSKVKIRKDLISGWNWNEEMLEDI